MYVMDFLYQKLPKDLVYIIEGYAKDRTQYTKVIDQLEHHIIDATQRMLCDVNNWYCHREADETEEDCPCEYYGNLKTKGQNAT